MHCASRAPLMTAPPPPPQCVEIASQWSTGRHGGGTNADMISTPVPSRRPSCPGPAPSRVAAPARRGRCLPCQPGACVACKRGRGARERTLAVSVGNNIRHKTAIQTVRADTRRHPGMPTRHSSCSLSWRERHPAAARGNGRPHYRMSRAVHDGPISVRSSPTQCHAKQLAPVL